MAKQVIRLTESELVNIVKRTARQMMRESVNGIDYTQFFEHFYDIAEEIMSKLAHMTYKEGLRRARLDNSVIMKGARYIRFYSEKRREIEFFEQYHDKDLAQYKRAEELLKTLNKFMPRIENNLSEVYKKYKDNKNIVIMCGEIHNMFNHVWSNVNQIVASKPIGPYEVDPDEKESDELVDGYDVYPGEMDDMNLFESIRRSIRKYLR